MAKLIDISKDSLKHSVTRSVTKRRTTFWQMMRCIGKLQYRPSFLLVFTVVGALVYICTPLSMFSNQPVCLRFIDDIFVLFIVLKVMSHETHRFTRYKARTRRSCCD